jgi:hypothetical protein
VGCGGSAAGSGSFGAGTSLGGVSDGGREFSGGMAFPLLKIGPNYRAGASPDLIGVKSHSRRLMCINLK